ncbi:MAG: hypothetical protein U1F76_22175 [Candidatus Competibacteraceae bacterium]
MIVEKLRRSTNNLASIAFAPDKTSEETLSILRTKEPSIAEEIEKLSRRYKAGDEDISVLSDTEHYLKGIGQFLAGGTLLQEKLRRRLFRDYLEKHYSASTPSTFAYLKLVPNQIEQNDPLLHMPISSRARVTTSDDLSEVISRLLGDIAKEIELEEKDWQALQPFPTLRDTLLASRLETTLREDGHHLIVRIQRVLAQKIIALGQHFFPDQPDSIFKLSTYEFVSLVKGSNCSKIREVARHWQKIGHMERRLEADWNDDPAKALRIFEEEIKGFLDKASEPQLCKGDQYLAAQLERKRNRLDERIRYLHSVSEVTRPV